METLLTFDILYCSSGRVKCYSGDVAVSPLQQLFFSESIFILFKLSQKVNATHRCSEWLDKKILWEEILCSCFFLA